ncbi:MAG: DUF222 domain-containing protein [Pseudonocardiaceae bacterium]|nr:DUF222 domain-containing protein [Pseudonocardiaceae bacterium]
MSGRQRIPEDLADMAPGPELAAVLAGIELSRLSGFDAVEVLRARYRQLNHDRAGLMATMVEVGLCDIGPDDELPRRATPDEFAADEVRAALVFTRRAAEGQLWLAYDLCSRLPAVHAAMTAGDCDEPRARIFSEWTADLSEQQARALCEALLPRLGELTTGALIEAIKKAAIAIDPDWARRRYEQALADRKVVGRRNPDGSANLSGYNLPVDRVAAAGERIDALARAAKRGGDARPIDHLRAELFLGMTDGAYVGCDDATILELLLANSAAADTTATTGTDAETGAGPGPGAGAPASGPDRDASPCGARGRAGIELRVRISTLLGADRYPGEIVGWGPVHAELARDLIATLDRAQWRFAITDEHGQLACAGITRARPAGTPPGIGRSGDVVELQIPAALLDTLAGGAADLGAWAPVVTDLARQHTQHEQATQAGADPFTGDADRRYPGAAQRRHLQIRDRRCIGLGCRAPARGTDQDHTRDHQHGGPTLPANLGGPCRHDHRLKHEGGWRLDQPAPGHFRWTSRLGHVYLRQLEPIIEPLPDPIPRDRDPYPVLTPDDRDWEGDHILEHPPPEPEPPPAPPPHDPDTDPPPF